MQKCNMISNIDWLIDLECMDFFETFNYGSTIEFYNCDESIPRGIIIRHDPISEEIVHQKPFIEIFYKQKEFQKIIPYFYIKKGFRYDRKCLELDAESPIDLYLFVNRRHLLIGSPALLPILNEKDIPLQAFGPKEMAKVAVKWQNRLASSKGSEFLPFAVLNKARIEQLMEIACSDTPLSNFIREYWDFETDGITFRWVPKKLRSPDLYERWLSSPRIVRSDELNKEYQYEPFDDNEVFLKADFEYILADVEVPFEPVNEQEQATAESAQELVAPIPSESIVFDAPKKAELWSRFQQFLNRKGDPLNVYEITSDSMLVKLKEGEEYILAVFLKTDSNRYEFGSKSVFCMLQNCHFKIYGINSAMIEQFSTVPFIQSVTQGLTQDIVAQHVMSEGIKKRESNPEFIIEQVWEYDSDLHQYIASDSAETSNYRKLLRIQELANRIKAANGLK